MGLRDIEANLPPGFRFYPSDEELVCHYLYKKITNQKLSNGASMVEVDLHACEPWQLPDVAKLGEKEWYFFTFRERKYATGYRTNRATTSGYWKATGKDKPVFDPTTREIVGMRKTLVFYRDRAPNGIKTDWVMHEFRMENQLMIPNKDWVLCRVFHKSKGELITTKLGLETDYDEITTTRHNTNNNNLAVSSSCYTQDHQQTMSANGGYHDQQQQQQLLTTFQQFIPQFNNNAATSPTPFLNLGVLLNTNSIDDDDHQFMGTQHEQEENNSRNGDEFGFLYDMIHDENNNLGIYM